MCIVFFLKWAFFPTKLTYFLLPLGNSKEPCPFHLPLLPGRCAQWSVFPVDQWCNFSNHFPILGFKALSVGTFVFYLDGSPNNQQRKQWIVPSERKLKTDPEAGVKRLMFCNFHATIYLLSTNAFPALDEMAKGLQSSGIERETQPSM